MNKTLTNLLENVSNQYACQPTFNQVTKEIIESLEHYLKSKNATQADYDRVTRLVEPERIVAFKVIWSNDKGELQLNRGWRVQFNSALGPYKGGLRFDPSVNEDILKFLGFEQIFKNALTGLPLGGGKGGSDFNPKGKTDNEIRTFCRAYMSELFRHIGPETDVPAGDIGVGSKEIGYLYGMYKQLLNRSEGTITGKPVSIGGSLIRTEATGYGIVYFTKAMLSHNHKDLTGLRAVVSGAGNVAEYTARKLVSEGACVLTMSDRSSYIYKKTGFSSGDIDMIMEHKNSDKSFDTLKINGIEVVNGTPWQTIEADLYLPCATQNEVSETDVKHMVKHAVAIVEGANMPLSTDAQKIVRESKVLYGPSKAANAGGVAVSSLEMTQNASHAQWTAVHVDDKLQAIMQTIHNKCAEYGTTSEGNIDYVLGANIAGGARVLEAMEQLGW